MEVKSRVPSPGNEEKGKGYERKKGKGCCLINMVPTVSIPNECHTTKRKRVRKTRIHIVKLR